MTNIKKLATVAAALSAILLTTSVHAHITLAQQQEASVTTTDLGHGIYMLQGQGGNVGFSTGEDGVFVIDGQFDRMTDKILSEIREKSDQPIEFLLNTHWHGDHTGSNTTMSGNGTTVISHDNVRVRMKESEDKNALPSFTFSEHSTLYRNGLKIKIKHLPNAHTDGDSVVYFKGANVLHTGDTHFQGRFPYIDFASGGTVDGAIAGLNAMANMINDDTKVIPGHGPLTNKEGLLASAAMLIEGKSIIKKMRAEGMSDEEIVASNPLNKWADDYNWRFINAERMTKTFLQDLN